MAVRVVGENSSQLADAVRAGRLEAGLVALPIDDDGLEVGAAVAQFEVVYATRGTVTGPVTIEQLARSVLVLPEARWGDEDPTRRQLAERAQRAGVTIRPRIEVQHANAALELAARGLGDTLVTRALLDALGYSDRLATVPLDPPLHEAFAFIRRRNARLSPATRALMTLAQHHLAESRPRREQRLRPRRHVVEQACATQPRVDGWSCGPDRFAANREACADACALARLRVVLGGRAQPAHGVRRERVDVSCERSRRPR